MTDAHRSFQELLPWYVNGTLDEDERASIEHHLESCEPCREEIDCLEEIRLQIRLEGDSSSLESESGPPTEVIWARLGRENPRPRAAVWNQALRWIVAGQAAAILILATMLVGSSASSSQGQRVRGETAVQEGPYRTLSAESEATVHPGQIRLVIREHVPEIQMRELLLSNSLEIVAGPNRVGAYLLKPPGGEESGKREALIVRLRGDPRVLMAEPVGSPALAPPLP